jgi:hypothetical protein
MNATTPTLSVGRLIELDDVHGQLRRYHRAAVAAVTASAQRPTDPVVRGRLRQVMAVYVDFIDEHQRTQDAGLLAELRATEAALGPVLDQLVADHDAVSSLLEDTRDRVRALAGHQPATAVGYLSTSVEDLGRALLAHLDRERQVVSSARARSRAAATSAAVA